VNSFAVNRDNQLAVAYGGTSGFEIVTIAVLIVTLLLGK
jgi:hypothetical protein